MLKTFEVNFDGLVGPSHNHAGLSSDNEASQHHAGQVSNPKAAALQGLEKMKGLHERGFVQGIIPPQPRPDFHFLRQLGFKGSDAQVAQKALKAAPHLLATACSASMMWTANAATVSPSVDCADGKVHITPANLISKAHRSIEPANTGAILKSIFNNERHFQHHQPLPATLDFADEGAANHTRFCQHYNDAGLELFVYGQRQSGQRYIPRQTVYASQAIARLHQLSPAKTIFTQQNAAVIDQGVFHNDVIAVGNQNVLFCHEHAFVDQQQLYLQLCSHFADGDFHVVEVSEQELSVKQAVSSYLFNSQLLSQHDDSMLIVVPQECRDQPAVWSCLQRVINDSSNPINEALVFDLRGSMHNGGGPACLRLRVVLNEHELAAVNPQCLFSKSMYEQLTAWVNKHYRERLTLNELADPQFHAECDAAMHELYTLLNITLT